MINQKRLQKNIGVRIRQLRLEKGMTQEELAASVNKQRPAIQRIEGGNNNPSIFTLREIADGLGVKLDDLLAGIK